MDIFSYLLGKKAGGGSTPNLQEKSVTITENGTQNVTADTGYDGLSNVSVTTNVPIPSLEINANTSSAVPARFELPQVTIASNVTSLNSAFKSNKYITGTLKLVGGGNNLDIGQYTFQAAYYITKVDMTSLTLKSNSSNNIESLFEECERIEQITGLNQISVNNVQYFNKIFYYCPKLTEIDISQWQSDASGVSISQMFQYCNNLQKIDMRSFNFSNVTTYNNAFSNVPTNCLVIVADATQKSWMNAYFPSLTNVKTVAEYEG